jgi:hypothetical protein
VQVQRLAGRSNPSITIRLYTRGFERAKRQYSIREKLALRPSGISRS